MPGPINWNASAKLTVLPEGGGPGGLSVDTILADAVERVMTDLTVDDRGRASITVDSQEANTESEILRLPAIERLWSQTDFPRRQPPNVADGPIIGPDSVGSVYDGGLFHGAPSAVAVPTAAGRLSTMTPPPMVATAGDLSAGTASSPTSGGFQPGAFQPDAFSIGAGDGTDAAPKQAEGQNRLTETAIQASQSSSAGTDSVIREGTGSAAGVGSASGSGAATAEASGSTARNDPAWAHHPSPDQATPIATVGATERDEALPITARKTVTIGIAHDSPAQVSGNLNAGGASLSADVSASATSIGGRRATTAVGSAVLQNWDNIDLAGALFLLEIDKRIAELRATPPNSDVAKALHDQKIADCEDLKRRVEEFLGAASEFVAGQGDEKQVVTSKMSIADGLSDIWTHRHLQIADWTLFGSAALICMLAGPVASVVAGVVVGGPKVVDALREARKMITGATNNE